jgi:hypothetical protein
VALAAGTAAAAPAQVPVDDLATDDPRAIADAVRRIEQAPADPDALVAAARACEDKLLDPARALALYERIARELPDARITIAARRRAETLRAELGASGEHAREAAEAARLIAEAEQLAPDELIHRADALVLAPWPGAPRVARWTGDWLCRHGRYEQAQQHYEAAAAANASNAGEVLRAATRCALDTRDWARAERLANRLPIADDLDRDTRDDMLAAAARGRARDRWYLLAWIALVVALGGLIASWARTVRRRPRPTLRDALRAPVEVAYFAPIAAVLVAIAFTAHAAIAPAVLRICSVGLVTTWLSGTTLEVARSAGRRVRVRSIAHVAACAIAVIAIGYIALTRDGLLDMLAETVKFGPGG